MTDCYGQKDNVEADLVEKSEPFSATALVRKCGSPSLFRHLPQLSFTDCCPQCPDLTTLSHTHLHSTIYCYLHPQLLLLLLLLLLLWLFLLLFLVLFSWSNISFWLAAVVLVMRDIVKERNTAKTERKELEAVTE